MTSPLTIPRARNERAERLNQRDQYAYKQHRRNKPAPTPHDAVTVLPWWLDFPPPAIPKRQSATLKRSWTAWGRAWMALIDPLGCDMDVEVAAAVWQLLAVLEAEGVTFDADFRAGMAAWARCAMFTNVDADAEPELIEDDIVSDTSWDHR